MKASLTLVKVPVTAEKLAILFEKLTGRKPTDQEIDEVRRTRASPATTPHLPGVGEDASCARADDCVRLDRDG